MVEILTLPDDPNIESSFEPCGARCGCAVQHAEPMHYEPSPGDLIAWPEDDGDGE